MSKKKITYYVIGEESKWNSTIMGDMISREIHTISPDRNSNYEKPLIMLWDQTHLPGIIEVLERNGLVKWDVIKHGV